MNNELVSVIILTHNRLHLLKRAIDSVLHQSHKNIECIVVDNGSTDGTGDYCRGLEGIHYIHSSPSIGNGCNQARNLGISFSKGEWCAFLDDDDCWMPTKIEKQLEVAFEKNCDVVFCGIKHEIIHKTGYISFYDQPVSLDLQGDLSKKSLYRQIAYTSTLMIRKTALNAVGCFDVNQQFWQETELLMRLSRISPFYAVEEPLVIYREDTIDPARQSNRLKGWHKSVKYCYQKHAKLVAGLSLYERYQMYRRLLNSACFRSSGMPLLNTVFNTQILVLKAVQRTTGLFGVIAQVN